jgi:hypothetical protein
MGIVEFNQVLSSIKRYLVKEVILSEINLISAKIDSLKELTVAETDNVMLWSDVVARKKKTSPTLQNNPLQIPVMNNRFDLLPLVSTKYVMGKQTVQMQCNKLKVKSITTTTKL